MSIAFDGGNDRSVLVSAAASIDNIWDGGGSLSVWINLAGAGESNTGRICDKRYDGATNTGWTLQIGNADMDITFAQDRATTDGAWTWDVNLSTGIWYHLVLVYDDDNVANDPVLYLGGVDQVANITEDTTPVDVVVDDSGRDLNIGIANTVREFNGQTEDVRLFSRTLTAEEAFILAAGYRGVLGGEAMWLSMNEATGAGAWEGTSLTNGTNILPDLSVNSNTGDPVNTPTGKASECPRYGVAV